MASKRRRGSPLPYILFVFALTAAVVWLSLPRDNATIGEPKAKPAKRKSFWTLVEEHQPVFQIQELACPCDGTKLQVPAQPRGADNALGGLCSDMMALALSPPEGGQGPPRIENQQYDQLLTVCPSCKSTYMYVDVVSFSGGRPPYARKNLGSSWDLSALSAPLAAKAHETWTYDEKAFCRYLTVRTAWMDTSAMSVELGFAALAGAYCSNTSLFLGREYKIPAAAFYALAAAEFESALESDKSLNPRARAMTTIELAECQRLLGRQEESLATFSQARSIIEADLEDLSEMRGKAAEEGRKQTLADIDFLKEDQTRNLQVLEQLEASAKSGDFDLQRLVAKDELKPPVGWYVELMLPGINGELAVQREKWAGYRSADAIVEAVNALLASGG